MPGHLVRFIDPQGGWHRDKDHNLKYLEPNQIYVIERTVVHNSSTDVYLKGPEGIETRGESLCIDLGILKSSLKGIRFNSSCFEDVTPQDSELTQQHPDCIRYNKQMSDYIRRGRG